MLVSIRDRAPQTDKFPHPYALDDTEIFALSKPIHGCSAFYYPFESFNESVVLVKACGLRSIFLIIINLFSMDMRN
jgi:hypothetical protein